MVESLSCVRLVFYSILLNGSVLTPSFLVKVTLHFGAAVSLH